jgi:hypothetical protein
VVPPVEAELGELGSDLVVGVRSLVAHRCILRAACRG